MILMDIEMLDAPLEGPTPKKEEDVEIIDTLAEGVTHEQGIMEIILDSRITELDLQAIAIEELESFPVDPQDLSKRLKELNPEDK